MTLKIERLHPHFFAEVSGADLKKPLTPAQFAPIKAAFDEHAVLLFRDQHVNDDQHVDFSEHFGPVFTATNYHRGGEKPQFRAEMADISNVDRNGDILKPDNDRRQHAYANQLWHTDNSFKHIPSRCSLLAAHKIPLTGGDTEFADMRAAYDALPAEKKAQIDNLIVEHSIFRSREQLGYDGFSDGARNELPPVQQVLVRTLEATGRKALYIASHASHVTGALENGVEVSSTGWTKEKSRALLQELIDFATQPEFTYRHNWRPGDLIVWDNRCTMHRAHTFEEDDQRRILRRTTVSDEINSVDRARGQLAA